MKKLTNIFAKVKYFLYFSIVLTKFDRIKNNIIFMIVFNLLNNDFEIITRFLLYFDNKNFKKLN